MDRSTSPPVRRTAFACLKPSAPRREAQGAGVAVRRRHADPILDENFFGQKFFVQPFDHRQYFFTYNNFRFYLLVLETQTINRGLRFSGTSSRN